jgi:hypothetical protein
MAPIIGSRSKDDRSRKPGFAAHFRASPPRPRA